jgi:hypothetical protein
MYWSTTSSLQVAAAGATDILAVVVALEATEKRVTSQSLLGPQSRSLLARGAQV